MSSKKNERQKNLSILNKLKMLFTFQDADFDKTFSLGRREPVDIPGGLQKQSEQWDKTAEEEKKPKQPIKRRPRKVGEGLGIKLGQAAPKNNQGKPAGADSGSANKQRTDKWEVATDIEVNLKRIKKTFNLPKNKDMVVREFYIALDKPVRAFVVYIDGAVNSKVVDDNILQPLMLLANLDGGEGRDPVHKASQDPFDIVNKRLSPINQATPAKEFNKLVAGVLNGDTVVFVDGADQGLILETKNWPGRSVSDPKNESSIRGPQEGFAENLRTNTGLVRKRLRTEALVTEIFQVGRYTNTNVALMYIEGIVNPKLVREMKRRIKSINVDYVGESGILEQFIDENQRSFAPTVLTTERPDRVAAFLCEGHLALIVDGSTYALIMPVTFWAMMHAPDDYYLRWPFASFIRWLRFIAFFLAMLTPAAYIAITNYHPEMIPTDLLLSIAATREKVPFPVVIEVLLMEFSFELIREAGLRIPGVIGPTIGIVGALILGQAAVAASIVSPILVIVVAVTGLASSALPSYNFNLSLRIIRFVFVGLASLFGFVGIAVGLFFYNVHTVGQKSLGVPMVSPVAPWRPPSHDQVTLPPYFTFEHMPRYMRTMHKWRQVRFNRVWSPQTQNLYFQEKASARGKGRRERN